MLRGRERSGQKRLLSFSPVASMEGLPAWQNEAMTSTSPLRSFQGPQIQTFLNLPKVPFNT